VYLLQACTSYSHIPLTGMRLVCVNLGVAAGGRALPASIAEVACGCNLLAEDACPEAFRSSQGDLAATILAQEMLNLRTTAESMCEQTRPRLRLRSWNCSCRRKPSSRIYKRGPAGAPFINALHSVMRAGVCHGTKSVASSFKRVSIPCMSKFDAIIKHRSG
jgi:hypothetical protein